MCGIAGLIAPADSSAPLDNWGEKMQNSLLHRGPDNNGVWIDRREKLVLVHTRLAIQDLSSHGDQPMWSHTGRYCIVFNGEIYNFQALAAELKTSGHAFSGHSDTEILLTAIEEWGLNAAIKRAIGMFAFALWDAKNRTLSLCRDRMGEKPLYYGWHGQCFYFSSELKAIESVTKNDKLDIDHGGLSSYMRYGYISAPHSIYRGIYKLIPGTIFTFSIKDIFNKSDFSPCADSTRKGPKTYWSVLESANTGLKNQIENETEAIEQLDSLLHNTIRMQKVADVDVGVFLSGGIDSSTVAAITQSESAERIKTFTIGFNEEIYDESRYAEKIAAHLGTDHSTVRVSSNDTLNLVPELPVIFDEPFADSSQIPTYIISEFARRNVTVCLSGDGGDELFAGYNRYLSTDHIWKKSSFLPFAVRKNLGKLLAIPPVGFWENLYNGIPSRTNNDNRQKHVGLKLQKLAGLMQKKDLMSGYDYLLSCWDSPEEILSVGHKNNMICPEPVLPETSNFIEKATFLDQTEYLQGDNLAKVDRASMAVSLETRLPLLSHEVVELSWRLPATMKARGDISKWALRQVLYKYIPEHLIERPKMGFSVPVAKWLREDLRDWAADMLGLMPAIGPDFLRQEIILSAWNDHLRGKRDNSQKLWAVLMLLAWMNNK